MTLSISNGKSALTMVAFLASGYLALSASIAPAQAGALRDCRLDAQGNGTHVCQCYVLQQRSARSSILARLSALDVCGAPGVMSGGAFNPVAADNCHTWKESKMKRARRRG